MRTAWNFEHRLMPLVVAAVMAGGCAHTGSSSDAQKSGTGAEILSTRYPAQTIDSAAVADQALEEVRDERERVRKQFAVEERACYDRFFTNLCLDDVKERQRLALGKLRRIEVEANAFQRRDRLNKREQRQADRQEERRLPIPAEGSAPTN